MVNPEPPNSSFEKPRNCSLFALSIPRLRIFVNKGRGQPTAPACPFLSAGGDCASIPASQEAFGKFRFFSPAARPKGALARHAANALDCILASRNGVIDL